MPKPGKTDPIVDGAERVVAALEGFDFRVDPEDFVFYELARLIDEDRASFDEEDFRRLIDAGVHAHIEQNMAVRSDAAGILRAALQDMAPQARTVAFRVIHALEDISSDLTNAGVLVLTYTSYLFRKLQTVEVNVAGEEDARTWISRWLNGEILREELLAALRRIGAPAIGPAADLLFESTEDRSAAETAISVLASIRSPVSARVLAHGISEPLLDEDLETTAYTAAKAFWPIPRDYMIYQLRGHAHEDIPVRWFQLFVETDEPLTVDLALEELRAHEASPEYREDLAAMLQVLEGSRDPEAEDKILATLNATESNSNVRSLLGDFLQRYKGPATPAGPWAERRRAADLNRQYIAAATLLDSNCEAEGLEALEQVLANDPKYPLAVMLKRNHLRIS